MFVGVKGFYTQSCITFEAVTDIYRLLLYLDCNSMYS